MEGFGEARKDDFAMVLYGAWHVAAFSRARRLPRLRQVMDSMKEHKPQSTREVVAALRAKFGGADG